MKSSWLNLHYDDLNEKKIVILGPPEVGKTTLRKIFFEGENSSKLLNYALEPTRGQETILVNMGEEIGVFDLAGQENYRWLETEEKEIFYDTNVIVVVIDINTSVQDIKDFFLKIINIRKELNEDCFIHLLIHKIDLISRIDLISMKGELERYIRDYNSCSVSFSSIKHEYIAQTFAAFVNIIKTCIKDKDYIKDLDVNLINASTEILEYLNQELVGRLDLLQVELNLTKDEIIYVTNFLVNSGYIEKSDMESSQSISITDKGKHYYKNILKELTVNSMFDLKKADMYSEKTVKPTMPPFIGYFIADKDGKVWYTIEIEDGILKTTLEDTNEEPIDKATNIELIPMFISALEKFSSEINIKNLSGFCLMGSNVKMQVFDLKNYTVTLFSNPNINLTTLNYKIQDYFLEMFKKYGEIFEEAMETGFIEPVKPILNECRDWLIELNDTYKHMIVNFEIFDFENAQKLYGEIEETYDEINSDYSNLIEKIKKLKTDLMNAVLQENLKEVMIIAKNYQDFRMKLNS